MSRFFVSLSLAHSALQESYASTKWNPPTGDTVSSMNRSRTRVVSDRVKPKTTANAQAHDLICSS